MTHDAAMYKALQDGRSMSLLANQFEAVEMTAKVDGWKLRVVRRLAL